MPDPRTQRTYLKDGKVVSEKEVLADPVNVWTEVRYALPFLSLSPIARGLLIIWKRQAIFRL